MKIIVVLVALTSLVKGLPQYNYPKVTPGKGYKYNRPTTGDQNINEVKEESEQEQEATNEDRGINKPGSTEEEDEAKPLIHKHIYVHVPPPELEDESKETKKIKAGRGEKHYKIIFIKAPTQSPSSVSVAAQAAREEKTIVYVLVKRPDDDQEITLATPKPTEPSKPEVYFIRYKAKKKEGEKKEGETSSGPGKEEDKKEEVSAEPGYLPPSSRLRLASATDYNSQDYDSYN